MKFRNYCVVIIGNTTGVESEIIKVSEIKPNFFDGKGLFISTFSSIMTPSELTDWFIECNRNFMVFDMDENSSGFSITNKMIHDGLFGFVNEIDVEVMNSNFNDFIEAETITYNENGKRKLNADEIEKMCVADRQNLLNELIEFGLEKLSDEDKNLLPLLAK